MADNKTTPEKQTDGVRIKVPGVVILTTVLAAVVSIGSTASLNAYNNGDRDSTLRQHDNAIRSLTPKVDRMDKNLEYLRTKFDPTYKGPD